MPLGGCLPHSVHLSRGASPRASATRRATSHARRARRTWIPQRRHDSHPVARMRSPRGPPVKARLGPTCTPTIIPKKEEPKRSGPRTRPPVAPTMYSPRTSSSSGSSVRWLGLGLG